jgi:hypothetical protein
LVGISGSNWGRSISRGWIGVRVMIFPIWSCPTMFCTAN